MAVIALQSVSVSIGHRTLLRDIDLELQRGQRLAVIGPSGAGKTSLLRTMAGLQQTSSGRVLKDGVGIGKIAPEKRETAMLSQDYALYPQLSVLENLRVSLRKCGLSKAELAKRIEHIIDAFDLAGLENRLPSQISGGQSQRVALAKALVPRPGLLLLDEPLSQLDSQLRLRLIEAVISLSENWGTAVCWVAHDPLEAFRIATRVAVMNEGRIIQNADPHSLYLDPVNRIAADLTSPWGINWMPLKDPGFQALRSWAPPLMTQAGIRPEHCIVAGNDLRPDENQVAFKASILQSQFIGFSNWLIGELITDPYSNLVNIDSQSSLQDEANRSSQSFPRFYLLDQSGLHVKGDTVRIVVERKRLIWSAD